MEYKMIELNVCYADDNTEELNADADDGSELMQIVVVQGYP